jgi:hypothetical protein
LRNQAAHPRDIKAKEILEAGTPIGSALTDDQGRFAMPYCPPKGDVALAFIAFGPETGDSCEVLSWSCCTRPASCGNEVFSIGITEKRLAELRQSIEPEFIGNVLEDAKDRFRKLLPVEVPSAAQRLASLKWYMRAATDDLLDGHGLHVEPDGDSDEVRRTNAKLIGDTYRKRISKGRHSVAGVPQDRTPQVAVHRRLLKANKSRLGLPALSLMTEVNAILDRLRPAWVAPKPPERLAGRPLAGPAMSASSASGQSQPPPPTGQAGGQPPGKKPTKTTKTKTMKRKKRKK